MAEWRRQGGSDQMLLPLPLVLRSSRLTRVLCPYVWLILPWPRGGNVWEGPGAKVSRSGLCSDCIPLQSTWIQTQGGNVWEKAGVNVSVVYGSMPPEAYRAATGTNASAAGTVSCSVAHLAPGMPDSATETVEGHVSKPAWPRLLQKWAVLAVGGIAGIAAGSARGAAAAGRLITQHRQPLSAAQADPTNWAVNCRERLQRSGFKFARQCGKHVADMQPLSAAQADATDLVPFFAVGICRVSDSVVVLYQKTEADVQFPCRRAKCSRAISYIGSSGST